MNPKSSLGHGRCVQHHSTSQAAVFAGELLLNAKSQQMESQKIEELAAADYGLVRCSLAAVAP